MSRAARIGDSRGGRPPVEVGLTLSVGLVLGRQVARTVILAQLLVEVASEASRVLYRGPYI